MPLRVVCGELDGVVRSCRSGCLDVIAVGLDPNGVAFLEFVDQICEEVAMDGLGELDRP
jgi:hypothetical protein